MSYRDLRNMSEFLRRVGYPRTVSLENFRTPNFQLVADIGLWLVKQYDPIIALDFPSETGTIKDRVKFITTFSEFMHTKAQIKLNMKRLYQADGFAVKELIKVVSVLFTAMKESENLFKGGEQARSAIDTSIDFSTNVEDLRTTRALASEITTRGVTLYDLLQKEITVRESRHNALSKAFELPEIERLLQGAMASAESDLRKSNQLVDNLDSNFNSVTLKLEKKTQELERSEKRLQTLQKVRPAFMDEFEKLQSELEAAYREYVVRFRVLAHMEHQMEELSRAEAERKAEEKLIIQELGGSDDLMTHFGGSGGNLNGGSGSEEESDVDEDSAHRNAREFLASRPKVKRPQGTAKNHLGLGTRGKLDRFESEDGSRSRAAAGKSRNVFGSMLGGAESGDSESDLILLDGDNGDDNSDLGTDDDAEDDELEAPMRPLQGRALPNQLQEHIARTEMQNSAALNLMNGNGQIQNGFARKIGSGKHPSSDEGFRRLELQSQSQARTTVTTVNVNGGGRSGFVKKRDYEENGDEEDEEDLLIKPLQAPVMSKAAPRASSRSRSLASTSSSGSTMGNGREKSRTKLILNDSDDAEAYPPRPPTRPRSTNKPFSDDDF